MAAGQLRLGSAKQRGYGREHEALRRHWEAKVDAGEVACARCGKLIIPRSRWHLGHDHVSGTGYIGPEHERCSIADRNRRNNWRLRRRPPRPKQSRVW